MTKKFTADSPLNLTDAIQVTPNSVFSRTLEQSENFSITLFAMDAGQEISAHSSPKDAYVLVLNGEMEITIGDQVSIVRDNFLTHMPAEIPHALSAKVASRFILFMTNHSD